MLNTVFAMDILQHRSVFGFIWELRRYPSLMLTLGFKLRGAFHCDPAPGDSVFCRFCQLLIEIESDTGALTRVFHTQVDELVQLLPDFSQRTGYAGKYIRSHSTGKTLPQPERLKVPTRPLNAADGVDTILHTENGVLYCECTCPEKTAENR